MSIFRDPFSTDSTSGVLGLLIGLFVFCSFTGLGLLVYEGLDTKVPDSQVIANNNKEIKDLTNESAHLNQLKEKTLFVKVLQENLEEGNSMLVEAKTERDNALLALKNKHAEWEAYKNKYRANERKRAVGEVVDLSAQFDERYRTAVIRGVNDIEMKIMLDTGPKSIRYQELPKFLQDRFQFDDEQAKEMRAEIAEMENRVRREAQQHYAKNKKIEKAQSQVISQRDRQRIDNEIEMCRQLINNNELTISNLGTEISNYQRMHSEARSRGNISGHLGKASQMRAQIAKLRQQNNDLSKKIHRLRSMRR